MTVYVYTEYCDTCPYGTEIIEVYGNEQAAKDRLRDRVEEHYDMTLEELAKQISDYDEEVSETLVKTWEGDDRLYWVVHESHVL